MRLGDQLPLDDPRVLDLYSIDVAENSETVIALYDLAGGAEGTVSWHWRAAPGACRVVRVVMEADAALRKSSLESPHADASAGRRQRPSRPAPSCATMAATAWALVARGGDGVDDLIIGNTDLQTAKAVLAAVTAAYRKLDVVRH